ncbi:MAG: hypothetical protein FJ206_12915 [Gemmatimonadetes bacterium]|nr:hypothetical protein [Gemmatimonadota bacterium]
MDAEVARAIRLLVLDVDGVLTDNAVFLGVVDGKRVEFKRFDIQDGLGIGLLRSGPIEVAWLSGRVSEATTLRAVELRIKTVIQDSGARKLAAMERMLEERGLGWHQVAYVGDDLADLSAMERAALPIAVANAVAEIKRIAAVTTSRPGGFGAVREAIELLLRARGEWDAAVARYQEARDQ